MLDQHSFLCLLQILVGSVLRFLLKFVCVDPINNERMINPQIVFVINAQFTLASGDVNGDISPDFSGDVKPMSGRCICFLKLPLPPRDPRPPLPRPRRMPRANGLNVGDSSSSSIRILRFRPGFIGIIGGCGVFGSPGVVVSGGIKTPANCRGVV